MEKARSWKETIVIYCGFDCFRLILFINSSKELSNLLHLDILPPKESTFNQGKGGTEQQQHVPVIEITWALVVFL